MPSSRSCISSSIDLKPGEQIHFGGLRLEKQGSVVEVKYVLMFIYVLSTYEKMIGSPVLLGLKIKEPQNDIYWLHFF